MLLEVTSTPVLDAARQASSPIQRRWVRVSLVDNLDKRSPLRPSRACLPQISQLRLRARVLTSKLPCNSDQPLGSKVPVTAPTKYGVCTVTLDIEGWNAGGMNVQVLLRFIMSGTRTWHGKVGPPAKAEPTSTSTSHSFPANTPSLPYRQPSIIEPCPHPHFAAPYSHAYPGRVLIAMADLESLPTFGAELKVPRTPSTLQTSPASGRPAGLPAVNSR
jgi:hypothetical protein